jgi:sulfite reductase (NADPH) flavoprotein alpha-component
MATKAISIYFGTETGHSQAVAEAIAARAGTIGIDATVRNLANVPAGDLASEANPSVFVVSTWENGKPPFMARRFFTELEQGEIKAPRLRFAVIGLGNEHYEHFCGSGITLDAALEKIGGRRFMARTDLGRDYADKLRGWIPLFFQTLFEV